MWIRLLIALAPTLKNLIQAVTGVAAKTQQDSTQKAADLQAQADAHKAKAVQATNILNILNGILG